MCESISDQWTNSPSILCIKLAIKTIGIFGRTNCEAREERLSKEEQREWYLEAGSARTGKRSYHFEHHHVFEAINTICLLL
jgi:hypothetical protein